MNTNTVAVIFISFFACSVIGLTIGCDESSPDAVTESEDTAVAQTASVSLDVEGMTCVSCAASIEDAFDEAEGIESGDVDFGDGRADVDYDADVLDESAIVEIIENAGFEATVIGGDA